ncbi:MAG: hypothetical protein HY690_15500 [Chloroflexi bacterium]|nr:hypothetical protein [Chloroflexota bacterium]
MLEPLPLRPIVEEMLEIIGRQVVSQPDSILNELRAALPEGFHRSLLDAYIASPSQVSIEQYLDASFRRKRTD